MEAPLLLCVSEPVAETDPQRAIARYSCPLQLPATVARYTSSASLLSDPLVQSGSAG